jgi:hypothetical protein
MKREKPTFVNHIFGEKYHQLTVFLDHNDDEEKGKRKPNEWRLRKEFTASPIHSGMR